MSSSITRDWRIFEGPICLLSPFASKFRVGTTSAFLLGSTSRVSWCTGSFTAFLSLLYFVSSFFLGLIKDSLIYRRVVLSGINPTVNSMSGTGAGAFSCRRKPSSTLCVGLKILSPGAIPPVWRSNGNLSLCFASSTGSSPTPWLRLWLRSLGWNSTVSFRQTSPSPPLSVSCFGSRFGVGMFRENLS